MIQTQQEQVVSLKGPDSNISSDGIIQDRLQTIVLCVNIYLFGRISFSSIPRILPLMGIGNWIPSATAINEWVCKLGLKKLEMARNYTGQWIAIIDLSIDIAYKKVLAILRVPLETLGNGGSLKLADVECVALEVRERWNGESIQAALNEALGEAEGLMAIIKDGGTDLEKGVGLWRNVRRAQQKRGIYVISDISHFAANLLKEEFSQKLNFSEITGTVKGCLSKLYQSRFAFLAPPKVRTKARYMAISRLARWFDRLRNAMGGPGRASGGSLLEELRSIVGGLGPQTYILDRFSEMAIKLAEVMEILKNKGLNQETYGEVKRIVESLPPRSRSRIKLQRWLNQHLAIQKRLSIGQTGLVVSSDIIETLFGVYKNIVARSCKAEITRSALCIPALCGNASEAMIRSAIKTIGHKQVDDWSRSMIGQTNAMKRKCFFDGDSLEEILQKPGNTAA
ncbi:MAG: hypothetical protein M3Q07_28205 [Pseudobdellovibrionaceae bacterium]|nr:hypothetical protein [Pseudobdellovibrionaceae bacterium]